MNDTVHYETAPEDRISFGQKLIYGWVHLSIICSLARLVAW